MSELKTNPLSRESSIASSEFASDEAVSLNLEIGTRSAIVKAAAVLAASATKPEKRDIAKVIKDFKLAVKEVEGHFDLPNGGGPGNIRTSQGPIK